MFSNAPLAEPDVSQWDTSKVAVMTRMFNDASSANPDVSEWDISNVFDMSFMFSGATSAQPEMGQWTPRAIASYIDGGMGAMFSGTDIGVARYSALLRQLADHALSENGTLDGGFAKYNSDGALAREVLVNDRGWTITDGGRALHSCGDSVIDLDQGEACDDGNTVTESCAPVRQAARSVMPAVVAGATSYCGDGTLDADNGEVCDSDTVSCASLGYGNGDVSCLNDCSGYAACPSSDAVLESLVFSASLHAGLNSDVAAQVNGSTVMVELPDTVDISQLIGTFSVSADAVLLLVRPSR